MIYIYIDIILQHITTYSMIPWCSMTSSPGQAKIWKAQWAHCRALARSGSLRSCPEASHRVPCRIARFTCLPHCQGWSPRCPSWRRCLPAWQLWWRRPCGHHLWPPRRCRHRRRRCWLSLCDAAEHRWFLRAVEARSRGVHQGEGHACEQCE